MSVTAHDFLKPPSQPGDLGVLSHYRVIRELGRGGMGFVFLAKDIKLKRPVALKVMNQKIAAAPHSRRRFIREARAMAAVHHDNVVTIYEVGESNKTPFMAMELLKGSTLEAFNLEEHRLSFETIIDFARQIVQGLAAAHRRGIVHRDIKPANIWVEADTQRIKILDFGLALASTPVDQLAGRGAVIGTPGYLSPEQARSDPLDDRSDLYSLGVVLYELCTGRIPLHADSVPAQLISILAMRPAPIEEQNPDIPKPLCELIQWLLRKEPRSRPESAAKLLQCLDEVEAECHAKTEVAQAINKLKAGITEVVQQKQTFGNGAIDDSVTPRPSPNKGALPNKGASPNKGATSSPSHAVQTKESDAFESSVFLGPSLPAATAQTVQPLGSASQPQPYRAAGPQRARAATSAAGSNMRWQVYLPFAVLIALVCISLPVLTFFFSQAGQRTAAVVVTDPAAASASDPNSVGFSSDRQTAPIESTDGSQVSGDERFDTIDGDASDRGQSDRSSEQRRPIDQRSASSGRNRSGSQSAGPQQGNRMQNRDRAGDAMTGSDNSNGSSSSSIGLPSGEPMNSGSSQQDSGQTGDRYSSNRPPIGGNPDSKFGAQTPLDDASKSRPIENRWTTVSINEGRGADAMVQSGTTKNFGTTPSFGIRRRGDIETNHAYLRFDLESMKAARRHARNAELWLTVVGEKRPIGATIRLYGVKGVGAWPEEKLNWKVSFSSDGLDSLPLLASMSISEPLDPSRPQLIQIPSRKLAEFIASSDSELVTLVVAGSGEANEMVRFVSRDATDSSAAPKLRVSTPIQLPTARNRPNDAR